MFITLGDFSPANFIETEDYIEFSVVALTATCIQRSYGELCFPEEVLKEAAGSLKGQPVLLDHTYSVGSIVGVVVDARYEESKKGIVARLRIPKVGHEKLIALIKMTPSPIQNVSIGAEVEVNKEKEGKFIVKALRAHELSLVLSGADPNAKRIAACKCSECIEEKLGTGNWWDDPDLREKAPSDYFLDPSSRRYPYKTWEGQISCERLKAAMSLAGLHGHRQIYDRAKKLYERYCKEEKE